MSFSPYKVTLDHTLRDLYSLDGGSDQEVVLIHGMPDAKVQLISSIPLSAKFSYQSPLSKLEDKETLARLMLNVVPQVFGSIAGKMPVIMFKMDESASAANGGPHTPRPIYQTDAFQTFAQLAQIPDLSFISGPKDIEIGPGGKIAVAHPMDCLLHLPHTVNPEVHYGLLSKTNLAFCGLPSPPSEVINTGLQPCQLKDMHSLDAEVEKMLGFVLERNIPFVIKLPLAVLGQGVFIIRAESDRQAAVEVLRSGLRTMLQQLNDSNAHLRPSSLVIQEFIPGESVSISLFVTRKGRAICTSCCKQITDSAGNWGGAFISYREQDRLQQAYAGTIEALAKFVHEKGFYGPMGADVMTDRGGRQLIIDLNMRVTGSHPLGFLKTHFSRRGLHEAVVLFPLMLRCNREVFERAFESEFKDGSLVVNGWCHSQGLVFSITSLTLAAPDSEKLAKFIDRVNVYRLNE